jgi:UDP-N-acetylglucosamine 2-epimerase (non-hydrolysing)
LNDDGKDHQAVVEANTRKILVIFGTRPEAIKMAPVVRALRGRSHLSLRLCATGQHRDLLDQVLTALGMAPDVDLDLMAASQTLDALTARLVVGLGQVLDRERPDRVLVHGDTLTTMAAALAAYYRKIPVGHVEAGLRSNDIYQPWPEEVNRKVVATIADLNFAPTQAAAAALLRENIAKDSICVTGNTVIDALLDVKNRIESNADLTASLDPLLNRFADRRIITVTTHRRESFGVGMSNIADAIAAVAQRADVAFIFPVHPNPNVKAVMEKRLAGLSNVAMIQPVDYLHFVRLIQASYLILTDSGGVQEEAPSLGKPVLVMRDTTERPEGVQAGTAMLVGTDRERIITAINRLLDDHSFYGRMAAAHNPFGDGKAAERIAEIVAQRTVKKAYD